MGKGAWIAVQQPEVHLHPRAQAAFGEFIHSACSLFGIRFIVETHSDFVIDRYRVKTRDKPTDGSQQVCFFENSRGINRIANIPIGRDGMYQGKLPVSFRSFFVNESLNMMGL